MKVLLDACVWSGASGPLRAAGHDVVWAGDWSDSPGDQEIMERAASERRVLITLDKDFGEFAVVRRVPHTGIIRLVGFRAKDQGAKIREVLDAYASDLADGAIVTIEPSRVRVRPPDGTTN